MSFDIERRWVVEGRKILVLCNYILPRHVFQRIDGATLYGILRNLVSRFPQSQEVVVVLYPNTFGPIYLTVHGLILRHCMVEQFEFNKFLYYYCGQRDELDWKKYGF